MRLSSTGLDAEPHAGTISCQIEPQEMGTDSHCTVRLQTWGRNISPPATSLPPYSSSKHETNNNMAKVMENQVKHINTETRHAQWDRKVLTFLTHSANANKLKVSNHSTRPPKRNPDELLKLFDDNHVDCFYYFQQ